jgi:hypothetical protein
VQPQRAAGLVVHPGGAVELALQQLGQAATRSRSLIIIDSSKFSRKLRWSKLALPTMQTSSSAMNALVCSMRGPYS